MNVVYLNTKAWLIVIYFQSLVEILQNMLVICDEQGQTPSSGEGMDLVPLSKRPGAFTGFDSEACVQPGSKRSFQLFCDYCNSYIFIPID